MRRLAPLALALAACRTSPPASDDDLGSSETTAAETTTEATNPPPTDSPPELPDPAELELPRTLALPYTSAGQGGSIGEFALVNLGELPALGPGGEPLSWTLEGDSRLSLVDAPTQVEGGGEATLVLAFAGADTETIANATLTVEVGDVELSAAVFGVAGDPALPAGAWEDVELPGTQPCGRGLTIELPTAPFPHRSAGFTDARVHVFVPDDLRDVGAQDIVVHFHGHSTELDATLAAHRYREHLCASGVNGILVVPQGPLDTPSGNFGKLMDPGGLAALVQQVMVVLFREGGIVSPRLGELVLTAHSGGYYAVATNLDPQINALPVAHVHLYDAVYGFVDRFAAYVLAGGWLRSNYTPYGGTVDQNLALVDALEQGGVAVASEPTQRALRDERAILYPAATSHGGATRIDGAYGEHLRFALRQHRYGPRVELREASVSEGLARVRWFSPHDEQTSGFAVQIDAGSGWTLAAELPVAAEQASFPLEAGARVRVVPIVSELPEALVLGSDVAWLAPQGDTLIVDGFDRTIDGSFGGLAHDFAARVGRAAGAAASVSNEALREDGFELSAWPRTIWLLGDESSADHSLDALEQQRVADYLAGGGALIVSGSELAFELDASGAGAMLLADAFGATFVADDADTAELLGSGTLAQLGPLVFGGPDAAYDEDYPDVLGTSGLGEVVLVYDVGGAAAVGIAGQAVIVGVPLELIEPSEGDDALAGLLAALLEFVTP